MKSLAVILCLLTFSQADAPRDWNFPRDHGRHDGFKTEWWYFTANLIDASGRKFGCQLTFFRAALTARSTTNPVAGSTNDFYFAHAAVTDLNSQHFYFDDRASPARPNVAFASDQTLDVRLRDWSATLEDKSIHLREIDKYFSMDLACSDGRGPVLEGPGGVNRKGDGPKQASYYYSLTRLKTSGTLTVSGKTFAVTGLAWMDHEFSSNSLSHDQVGWDWMGLNLADGRDLMIYRLRGADDYLSGTVISPDGTPRYLTPADVSIAGSDAWHSPISGGAYPQEWTVHCDGLPPLTVRSRMPGQELNTNHSTSIDYFEGSSDVLDSQGRVVGEGYLELTGYAKPLAGL